MADPETQPTSVQPPANRAKAVAALLITLAAIIFVASAVIDWGGSSPEAVEPTPPQETVASEGMEGEAPLGDVELGSLSVTAYLCPTNDAPDEACFASGPVEVVGATLRLADGTLHTFEGALRMDDGSYAWLNIPIGEYVLLDDGLLGPPATVVRSISGTLGETDGGWVVSNLDPNQPAILEILFEPDDGAAAG